MEDTNIDGVGRMNASVRRGWRWWDALFTRYSRRRAAAYLHTFDDHRLKDIGITRGQIDRAVRGLIDRDRLAGRSF